MWWRSALTLILVYTLVIVFGGAATESHAQGSRKVLDYLNNNTVIDPAEVERLKEAAGFGSESGESKKKVRSSSTAESRSRIKERKAAKSPPKTRVASKRTTTTTVTATSKGATGSRTNSYKRQRLSLTHAEQPKKKTSEKLFDTNTRKTQKKSPIKFAPSSSSIASKSKNKQAMARATGASTKGKQTASAHRTVTYRAGGRNWSVVSGYEGGEIFYERTRVKNGKKQTVAFKYPPSERKKYDRIIKDLDKAM